MARRQDTLTLIGKRMQRAAVDGDRRGFDGEMPAVADLIRRIDSALLARRAA